MANKRSMTVQQFLDSTRLKELTPECTADERLSIVEEVAALLQSGQTDESFLNVVRGEVISALKSAGAPSSVRLFDSAMQSAKCSMSASSDDLIPDDPEPWPDPVDGSELLREIAAYLDRFVVLPAGSAIVIAAWSMATWCVGHLFTAPILALLSPTKQSGKTLTLSIIRRLVMRPLAVTSVTTAGTFRIMNEYSPTLLWDEAEALGRKGNPQQIGILNSGYQRGTAVIRCVGDENLPQAFNPFGFRAVGAIGTLAPTLLDRSIVIPMKRAPKLLVGTGMVMTDDDGTLKQVFNEYSADAETAEIRRKLARWTSDHCQAVGRAAAAPEEMQAWLGFRGSRNWAALFEIGRLAGGDTYQRLITASQALTGMCELTDDDEREKLVVDIAEVFQDTGEKELSSADLVRRLSAKEDSPWCEYAGGRPLTPHKLSLLLRPFGIAPEQFRSARQGKIRGYTVDQFESVFQSFGITLDDAA